ncbi:MAG: heparan-alpha-glucosaminide N-acetyltransferase domain-containing protein [Candidatus Bilamarchaeaceae archaeon]
MRIPSLDVLRGIAVLSMLFVNFITDLSYDLPLPLQHNLATMLPGDLIAPLFQFVLGMSLVASVARRKKKEGEKDIAMHVLKRAALLLLLGFFLDSSLVGFSSLRWGFLQSLAVGLLLSYALIDLQPMPKMAVAFAILLCYSALILYMPGFSDFILSSHHGGLAGALSYGAVAVFGTVAAEWLYGSKKKQLIEIASFGVLLLALATFASFAVPFNRLAVSPTYTLFAAGFSFVLAADVYFIVEIKHKTSRMLSVLGRNALSLWVAQYLFLYWPLIFIIGGGSFLPWYLGIAAAVMAISLFYVLADILDYAK